MSAGWINLFVTIAILLIVASATAIIYVAATRRGGKRKAGLAKPPKAHHQRVNPKTGDLFR